jgi:hypothetical protein
MPSLKELARENIDALLQQCGWILQDRNTIKLSAANGMVSPARLRNKASAPI